MTREDVNDIINAVCPNDEDYEKPCISPKHLRQELEQLALDQRQWNKEPTTKNNLGVDINMLALLEKTYEDFCKCEGGEGWLKIDGKEYSTDAGYAIEGVDIFMEVFKRRLAELPSVTPQPRKGHWTEEFNDLEGEVRFTCSSCGKYQLFGTDFCYNCGSDNREVEE